MKCEHWVNLRIPKNLQLLAFRSLLGQIDRTRLYNRLLMYVETFVYILTPPKCVSQERGADKFTQLAAANAHGDSSTVCAVIFCYLRNFTNQ